VPVAPTRTLQRPTSGIERVRHELLMAMHFGKLTPGDRAPSVRRLALRTGMNRKTVHRAYTRLAREGLLDVKPGSGTFISAVTQRRGAAPPQDLLAAARRCRAVARELGLAPQLFATFLDVYMGRGLSDLPLTVVECNEEQLGLIADELHSSLDVDARQVLLSDLRPDPKRAIDGSVGVVTTDCHRAEIVELVSPHDVPVYRLAFDSAFPQRLLDEAHRAPILMIVRDQRFASVFLGMLKRMAAPPDLLGRFTIVASRASRPLLRSASPSTTVFVSPLVEAELGAAIPGNLRRLRARWRLESGSLEQLRASLALDLATTRQSAV